MSLKLRGGVWHFRKMINGHIIARSTKTGDKALAEQIALKIEHEAVRSIMFNDEKPASLHAAIKGFLAARKGTGGHANAVVHMKHFQTLPDVPMNQLKLYQVQEVIAKRREAGAAHNTLAVAVSYWNSLQNFCKDQGWVQAVKLEPIKAKKTRIRTLNRAEEARLFQAIDPSASWNGKNSVTAGQRQDNFDLLVVLISLGCRLNEAQKLRWSQVDFDANLVHVKRSKGGIDSAVAMTARMRETLLRRKGNPATFVFPTKALKRVNTQWINDAVKRAGIDETAGRVTLHTMRHCVATRLLSGGMNIVEVQGVLGHKNLQSTLVYAHVQADSAARKAAEVLDNY